MNRSHLIYYLLCSNVILFFNICSAQVAYPLHPSVGDTIDAVEKLNYSLFEYTENNQYNFATIQFINSNFTLVENRSVKRSNGSTIEVTDSIILSQAQIVKEQQKVEKINAYHSKLSKERANLNKSVNDRVVEQKLPVRFAGPTSERLMLKRARMCRFEERLLNNEFETGLRPREDQLDIKQ